MAEGARVTNTTLSEEDGDDSSVVAMNIDIGGVRAPAPDDTHRNEDSDSDNQQQASTKVGEARETRTEERSLSEMIIPMEASSGESRFGSLHRRKAGGEMSSVVEEIDAVTIEDDLSSDENHTEATRMIELTESPSQTKALVTSSSEAEMSQKKVRPLTVWPTVPFELTNYTNMTEADAALEEVLGVAKSLIEMMSLAESNHVDDSMVVDIGRLKLSDIDRLSLEAHQKLGNIYEFSDEAFANQHVIGNLPLITDSPELWEHNDSQLREKGGDLEEVLDRLADNVRGPSIGLGGAGEMLTYLTSQGVEDTQAKSIVELLFDGQDTLLKEDSKLCGKESGGKLGFSYDKTTMWKMMNREVLRRVGNLELCLFSEQAIEETNAWEGVHINALTHAGKQGKIEGRTALHASFKRPGFDSLNEMTDKVKMKDKYPDYKLPTVGDMCERACYLREKAPEKHISGGTCDVQEAYARTVQKKESAKLHGFKVRAERRNRCGVVIGFLMLVGFFLVGAWGYTHQGNIFCTLSAAFCTIHNNGNDEDDKESMIYIDDGILINYNEQIWVLDEEGNTIEGESVRRFCEIVERIVGKGRIQKEKRKLYKHEIKAIGWWLDFREWKARPLQKTIDKLFVRLFVDMKLGETNTTYHKLDKMLGVMNWCGQSFEAGFSFMAQLFKHKDMAEKDREKKVQLSPLAMADIVFWRAIALVTALAPMFLGAPSDRLRKNKKPTWYLRTDASFIGGGGGLKRKPWKDKDGNEIPGEEAPGIEEEFAVRWTAEELQLFTKWEVSINVLVFRCDLLHHLVVRQIERVCGVC